MMDRDNRRGRRGVRLILLGSLMVGTAGAVAGTCDDQPGTKWDPVSTSCVQPLEQCFYLRTLWQGQDKVLTATPDGKVLLEDKQSNSPRQVWYIDPTGQQKWVNLRVVADPDKAVDFAAADSGDLQPVMSDGGEASSQKLRFLYNGRFEYIYTQAEGNRYAMDIVDDDQDNKPILSKRGNYAGQYWLREPASCDQAQRMLSAMQ